MTKLNIPPSLSAKDRSSFAYKTIKERLPVIVVKTIDFLHRQKRALPSFGGFDPEPNAEELAELESEAKELIGHIAKLRKELETNKPVELFEKVHGLPEQLEYFNDDIDIWNKALNDNKLDGGSMPLWFESPWLLVECYLYRRLKDYVLRTKHLRMLDLFVEMKQVACKASINQIQALSVHLADVEQQYLAVSNAPPKSERIEFGIFMQLALWANKCDLSLSATSCDKSQATELSSNLRDTLDDLHENILCDNLSNVWFKLQSIKELVIIRSSSATEANKEPVYLDLIADNSGFELFADLCLLHFLGLMVSHQSGDHDDLLKIRIHLKRLPWFVSDATEQDFYWLLSYMSTFENTNLPNLASKWKSNIEKGFWELHTKDKFWTLPHDYADMKSVDEQLYSRLATSSLIIFKGDLNYRKLVGDKKWHMLTPFVASLRGFQPAPLVALRTLKADVVVGIEDINLFAKINNNELPRDWLVSGNFGVIQMCDL